MDTSLFVSVRRPVLGEAVERFCSTAWGIQSLVAALETKKGFATRGVGGSCRSAAALMR